MATVPKRLVFSVLLSDPAHPRPGKEQLQGHGIVISGHQAHQGRTTLSRDGQEENGPN